MKPVVSVWLRSMTQHILQLCGLSVQTKISTILYEDNAACIAQLKGGYIKGDRTKHISLKFFFTHDLQQNSEIEVQQIRSSDNLADLFTKALPMPTFEKLIQDWNASSSIYQVKLSSGGVKYALYSFP